MKVFYSGEGTRERTLEELAYIHLMDFLDECQGNAYVSVCVSIFFLCSWHNRWSKPDRRPCFCEWSRDYFFTGIGQTHQAFFLHTDDTLPTASTYSIHLHLPVVHTEYKFKDIMIIALKGHGGFGLV